MKLSSSDDDLDFVNKKKKLRFGVQFSQEGNSREKFMVGSKSWGCIMFALVYISWSHWGSLSSFWQTWYHIRGNREIISESI